MKLSAWIRLCVLTLVSSAALAELPSATPVVLSIEAQPVRTALKAFAQQTGLQVLMRIEEGATDGLMAQPVNGTLAPQLALDQLLSRSGLTYEFVNERTVRITSDGASKAETTSLMAEPLAAEQSLRLAQAPGTAAPPAEPLEEDSLQEVTVFGRGVRQPVREIPQTVTSIGQELLLRNTVENTLDNVVRFIPSAAPLLAEYGVFLDVNVRGFDVTQIWNGMPFRSFNQSPSLSNVERVEVLMGPASVLYGSMEPGGVINIVTKQPRDEFHLGSAVEFGSYGARGGDIDIGGPLSDRIRARFNASYDETEAEFDFYRREKVSLAPVVAIDLAADTLLTLEGQYLKTSYPLGYAENVRPVVGTLKPNPGLGPIPESLNPYYMEDFTSSVVDSLDLSARLAHQFTEATSLNASFAYHHGSSQDHAIFAGFSLLDDARSTDRFPYIARGTADDYSFHVDLRHELSMGTVDHEFMVGADLSAIDGFTRYLNSDLGFAPLDVYTPDYSFQDVNPVTEELIDYHGETQEMAVLDRMRFNEKWALLVGLRYTDYVSESNFPPDFSGDELSSQFGVVYDLSDAITLFANRNEAFVPRFELDINNVPFEPEQSLQYELGTRFDIGATGLTGNATLFRIEKPNVIAVAPNNPAERIPAGEVRSQGVELSVQGKLAPYWSLYAGYGYTKAKVTKATEYTVTGAEFGNVPNHTFSLLSSYEVQAGLLRGLGLNLAWQYMGERWADAENTLRLPHYNRVDVGVSYPFTEHLTASLHGNHLADETIYSNAFSPAYTYVGVGRTWMARLRYEY